MLIVCPSCDSKVLVPDGMEGRKGKCSKCGAVFTIPAAPATNPARDDEAITTAPRPAPREEVEPGPPPRRRGEYDDDEDAWDEPRSLRRPDRPPAALSQAAMIVGIVAITSGTVGACCCGVLSTPVTGLAGGAAIVLGVMGQSRGGQGYAIAGMVTGFLAILLALGWVGLFFAVGGADLVGNVFRGKF